MRYPHYHNGKVAFTYMGDIWTADESGQNVQRLTAHRAATRRRDSRPTGKWIAFSSDREGNLDVWIVPASRRHAASNSRIIRPTTTCSAGRPTASRCCSPPTAATIFWARCTSCRSTAAPRRKRGPILACTAASRPTAVKLAVNRKGQSYWRKGYRGSYQTDVTVVDLKSQDVQGRDQLPRHGHLADVGQRRLHLFRQRSRRQSPVEHLASARRGRRSHADHAHSPTATCAFPRSAPTARRSFSSEIFGFGSSTWRRASPRRFRSTINAEPQDTLTEYRTVNSEVEDYDVAPSGPQRRRGGARRVVSGAGGRRRRPDAADQRRGPRPQRRVLARRQADRLCLGSRKAAARRFMSCRPTARPSPSA